MAPKPKLYTLKPSPAVRAVLITAKAIGLELDTHEINWEKGELHSPEFLKLNPQHTVPTLIDNGNVMWDSHAINAYLIGKYAKDDALYPKDLYQRALVDQRLYFDASMLFPVLRDADMGLMKKEIKSATPKMVAAIKESYDFLEKFLEGRTWAIGDRLTVADISLMTTTTSLDVHVPIDPKVYPNITAWLKRVQALPCCSNDKEDLQAFKDFIKNVTP